jgi:hypothetical protein
VITQCVAGQNPRKQFALGNKAPKGGTTEPILEGIHGIQSGVV